MKLRHSKVKSKRMLVQFDCFYCEDAPLKYSYGEMVGPTQWHCIKCNTTFELDNLEGIPDRIVFSGNSKSNMPRLILDLLNKRTLLLDRKTWNTLMTVEHVIDGITPSNVAEKIEKYLVLL